MPDSYKFHKLALAPFSDRESKHYLNEISVLSEIDRALFVDFVLKNGLGPFWQKLLQDDDTSTFFPGNEMQRFKNNFLTNTANYMLQKHVLELVTSLFTKESIAYAVFKGAHIREIIYNDNPSIRPAADIDLLVYPVDLERTVRVLIEAGFSLDIKEQNISHEVTLSFKNVAIDLHWHILRPGRLRLSLTDEFLETRQHFDTHTGFNAETTLFIMLVHPVFTKYSTTYLASLVRMIDLIQWIRTQTINWDMLAKLLKKYGVCTAAWITATYLEMLTGETLPNLFLQQIRPTRLKRAYLNNWLLADRSSNLLNHPLAIQLGFTLPAHDNILDALRFLGTLLQEKYTSKQKVEDLLAETSKSR